MSIIFNSLCNSMWTGGLLNEIFLVFDSIIYGIAGNTYDLFNEVVNLNADAQYGAASLFSNMPGIIDRIKTIFIVFMLFRLAFSLLGYLADPEKFKDSKVGGSKLLLNVVVSIAMLVSSNYVFDLLNRVQTATMGTGETGGSNIIANIVFGDSGFSMSGDNAGASFANKVFLLFCNYDKNVGFSNPSAFEAAANGANLYSSLAGEVKKTGVYYWPIISGIAGIVIIYFFFGFAIDVIVRLIKLKILEAISPIPIMLYVDSNSQKYFQNFVKLYTSTFLSFYFKLASVYLAVSMSSGILVPKENDGSSFWLKIVLVMGIFYLTKELPKIIKDLFGFDIGGSGIKGKGFLNALAGAGIGAIAGGFAGATSGMGVGGALAAAATGAARGANSGFSSKNAGDFVRGQVKATNANSKQVGTAKAVGGYGAMAMHGIDNITGANKKLEMDQAAVKKYNDQAKATGNSINDGLSHQMVTDEYGNSVQLGDEQTFTNRRVQNDNQYNLAKGMYDTATTDSDRATAAALMNERTAQIQSRAHTEYGNIAQNYAKQVVDNNGNSVESGNITLSYAQNYDSSASSTLSSSNTIGTRDVAAGRAIENLNVISSSTEFKNAASNASERASGTTPSDFTNGQITASTTNIMDVVGDKSGHVANLERNMSQTRQARYRSNSGGSGH